MIALLVSMCALSNNFTSTKCISFLFLHQNHFTQVHSPQITSCRMMHSWIYLSKYLIASYWLIGLLLCNDRFLFFVLCIILPALIETALYSQVSSKCCGNFHKFSEIFNNITPSIVIDIAIHFRYITVEQISHLLVWFWFRPSMILL